MIETDILYAYLKKYDWLKDTAVKLISKVMKGDFGTVYASREVVHEIYYVSMEEGVKIDEFISGITSLFTIENLIFLDTNYEIDLLALTLIKQYNLKSIFDAYYAATALNQVPDHTIISTDNIFDNIPRVKRLDPRIIV
ncbi:MAG: PIN domain-containing protein [Nitrososphaeria archaeon]|nr:PIN domain-containing protein [Nitrososphaeria archaeon]